jgi:hypothetical protein
LPCRPIKRSVVASQTRLLEVYVDEYLARASSGKTIDNVGKVRPRTRLVRFSGIARRTDEDNVARSLMLQCARLHDPEQTVQGDDNSKNPDKRGNRERDRQVLQTGSRKMRFIASH